MENLFNSILRNRETGCFIIGPKNLSSKIDQNFFSKNCPTAITHLIGKS